MKDHLSDFYIIKSFLKKNKLNFNKFSKLAGINNRYLSSVFSKKIKLQQRYKTKIETKLWELGLDIKIQGD